MMERLSPWRWLPKGLREPAVPAGDPARDLGPVLGSVYGRGVSGQYCHGASGWHVANFLVMDVFRDGVTVSESLWSPRGVMYGAFGWAEMVSLWMSLDTVGWRDADGWKWMFAESGSGAMSIFVDAVRVSEIPYDWRFDVSPLEWYTS